MSHSKARPTRRVWLPAALFGLFGLVLCARLVQLQVLEHERYAAEAKAGLTGTETVYARRGAILDRNGSVLATSVSTWDVYVNVRLWKDDATALKSSEELASYLNIDAARLREHVRASSAVEIPVIRDIEFEIGMEIIGRRLPGVTLLPNTNRVHPEGDLAASILGLTGLEKSGLAGIESRYNDALQGVPGRVIYERDTTGDPIT
jgi:cell division protein FtsI/penicillin-binding protein 2